MPRALLACRQPSCSELIEGGGYCTEHARAVFASPRRVQLPRDWHRRRARVLRRDGHRCVKCGAPARNVDHVIPRARGGTDDESNLVSLCDPHTAEKDAVDAAEGRRLSRG